MAVKISGSKVPQEDQNLGFKEIGIFLTHHYAKLAKVFAIDISAYAVMSSHTHIVLCVDKDQALAWSIEEVLNRWHQMFKGTLLTQRFMLPAEREQMSPAEILTVE